jgi:hypothetical protein
MSVFVAVCASLSLSSPVLAGGVSAIAFDLKTDWSDAVNPNGRWSYLEGANALPFVASWQSTLGGWSAPQPGWARSENGNNRLPFWFRSNGTETFSRDFVAGDIVVHSTDGSNGAGQGLATVEWRAPARGVVSVTGGVWMGRDIGRGNLWRLSVNNTQVRTGIIESGDPYSRANPYLLANGAGPGTLASVPIGCGGTVRVDFERTSLSGDFVGINLSGSFTPVPCLGDINGDGNVNTADLTSFLGQFGQSGTGLCADFNNDGSVNTADLVAFLGRFGTSCP